MLFMKMGAPMNNIPVLALELANSRKPRRPSGIREAYLHDPLETPENLLDFLRQLKYPDISNYELASLCINLDEIRALRKTVEQIVFQLTERKEFTNAIALLNESAKNCCWVHRLNPDGNYSDVLQFGTLAGLIASICIIEFAKCDTERIKICCRPECGLFFYDKTRNRSALWHAEDPCGWRTRSERRK